MPIEKRPEIMKKKVRISWEVDGKKREKEIELGTLLHQMHDEEFAKEILSNAVMKELGIITGSGVAALYRGVREPKSIKVPGVRLAYNTIISPIVEHRLVKDGNFVKLEKRPKKLHEFDPKAPNEDAHIINISLMYTGADNRANTGQIQLLAEKRIVDRISEEPWRAIAILSLMIKSMEDKFSGSRGFHRLKNDFAEKMKELDRKIIKEFSNRDYARLEDILPWNVRSVTTIRTAERGVPVEGNLPHFEERIKTVLAGKFKELGKVYWRSPLPEIPNNNAEAVEKAARMVEGYLKKVGDVEKKVMIFRLMFAGGLQNPRMRKAVIDAVGKDKGLTQEHLSQLSSGYFLNYGETSALSLVRYYRDRAAWHGVPWLKDIDIDKESLKRIDENIMRIFEED
ncbi:MAG: hypothetical protein J7K68_04830 [Candidatus Diapherotrites archaeon]|nr:hypothetical protein [Candidatus Diapherotrites archaeon]